MSYVFGSSTGQPYCHTPSNSLPASNPQFLYNCEPTQSGYLNGQTVTWHHGAGVRPSTPTTPIIPNMMNDDGEMAGLSDTQTHHIPLIPLVFLATQSATDTEDRGSLNEHKYLMPQTVTNPIPAMSLTPDAMRPALNITVDEDMEYLNATFGAFKIS